MSGLDVDTETGKMVITYGSRTVTTTDGKMVMLLPDSYDLNLDAVNVTFPDFSKDVFYHWRHQYKQTEINPSRWQHTEICYASPTVIPQEYDQNTVLGAAPDDADVLAVSIRLNRTTAPSHTWNGQTISPLPVMNQWIPFTGSILMEAALGMTRALSVYLSGGNVIMKRQQSVCVEPGGWGIDEEGSDTEGAFERLDSSGGLANPGSGPRGLVPFFQPQVAPYFKQSPNYETSSDLAGATYYLGQSNGCSIADPTNWQSIYAADLRIRFGRRS